jgi:hypothetical protein
MGIDTAKTICYLYFIEDGQIIIPMNLLKNDDIYPHTF